MHDIVFGKTESRQESAYEYFADHFKQICIEHRAQGRALAFAALVYDFSNAEIAEVVMNERYWDALDEVSGKYLTVFAFNISNCRRSSHGGMLDKAKKFVAKNILKESNPALVPEPALIFFQIDEQQRTEAFAVKIGSTSAEEAFVEIRKLLLCARNSIQQVLPQNKHNTEEIFELIRQELSRHTTITRFLKIVDIASLIRGVTG